jgi:uncharacterized membrane protein
MHTPNPKSTASIGGHPIHPMLIGFPISFFVATLFCDLVFWQSGNAGWATASMWLLGAGLLMAALAAVAGVADFLGDKSIRDIRDAWLHGVGNVLIVLLQFSNWYIRYAGGAEAVLPVGLILSLVAVAGLLYTGWKGWGMIYKHHVAVTDVKAPPSA